MKKSNIPHMAAMLLAVSAMSISAPCSAKIITISEGQAAPSLHKGDILLAPLPPLGGADPSASHATTQAPTAKTVSTEHRKDIAPSTSQSQPVRHDGALSSEVLSAPSVRQDISFEILTTELPALPSAANADMLAKNEGCPAFILETVFPARDDAIEREAGQTGIDDLLERASPDFQLKKAALIYRKKTDEEQQMKLAEAINSRSPETCNGLDQNTIMSAIASDEKHFEKSDEEKEKERREKHESVINIISGSINR